MGRWSARWTGRTIVATTAIVVALVLGGCGSSGTTSRSAVTVSGPGVRAGRPPWSPEHAHLAARLVRLGLPAAGAETFHIHALLSITVDGTAVQMPPDVGIDASRHLESTLHTHDATGIIHMEAPRPYPYTLGDVFAVWGVRFGPNELGGLTAHGQRQLHVYVNGRAITNPAAYVMHNGDNIAIGFGTDGSFQHDPSTAVLGLVKAGGVTCGASTDRATPSCSAPVTHTSATTSTRP